MNLTLSQMKNLSIDEIIKLYQSGCRLEEETLFENSKNISDPIIDPFVNFGKVTVSTGYSATDTSIILSSGNGSILPDPSIDGSFNVVWWNSTDYSDPTDDPNKEIVRVIAKSGDTVVIIRGQEGIPASIKNLAGKTYRMINALTAKTITDLQNLPAKSLQTSTGTLDVTTSTPTTGQVLTAISPTSATWQNLAGPQCFFVSFVASPNSGTFPLPVNYNATVIGGVAPYTYAWTFGDGYTSTSPAPNHTFTVNGSFTTNLTVTDSLGNSTTSATVITVTTGVGYVATGLGLIESLALPDSIIGFYNSGPTITDSYVMTDSLAGIYNASANSGSPLQDSIVISDSIAGIYNASANAGSPMSDSIAPNESLTFTNT